MPRHRRRASLCSSESRDRSSSRYEQRRHRYDSRSRRSRSRSHSPRRSLIKRRERNGGHASWSRSRSRHRHGDRERGRRQCRSRSASKSRSSRRYRQRRHHHSRSPSDSSRSRHGENYNPNHRLLPRHHHHNHQPEQQHRPVRGSETSGKPSSSFSGSGTSSRSRSPTPLRQDVALSGFTPIQDSDGHLIYKAGDYVGHYEIGRTLGEGTFGKVVSCIDHEEQRQVAVKVIKKVDRYRAAAKIEVEILKNISEKDPSSESHCIHLLDCFEYHGHVCLVFERLGQSLYDVLDKNGHYGYPMQQIRQISYQIASGLKFLHGLGLTHTDLKPENILFINSDADQQYNLHIKKMISVVRSAQIKLIDFGSATYDGDHHGRIVATRHYRPLEIILELGWNNMLDMWSLGCIIYELYTGQTLFQTHSNREHLAMMEAYIGHIPQPMIRKSPCRQRYFHSDYSLDWDRRGRAHRFIREHSRPLRSYRHGDDSDPDVSDLFDLIIKLMVFEPKQRHTASEAMDHRFFGMYT